MDLKTKITLNNGVSIPQLGIGTWQMQGIDAEQSILWALEAGYRHIDTAAIYGNEVEVGNAIKKSGIKRDELFITTKLWNDAHDDVMAAFTASLDRLKLKYVDLYLIHWPAPKRNVSWKVLESMYTQGLARSIGVSNFTIAHLEQLKKIAKVVPAVNQVEMTPWLYQKELIEYCKEHEIAVEAYSPLTRGHKFGDPVLQKISFKYKKTPAQILIRWALQHDMIVIPKSSNKQRIQENADVFDFDIDLEDMKKLDSLNEGLRFCWDPSTMP